MHCYQIMEKKENMERYEIDKSRFVCDIDLILFYRQEARTTGGERDSILDSILGRKIRNPT